MFDIWRLCFSRTLILARAAVKASSWNGFGCARILCGHCKCLCACGRNARGLPRGAVACEAPAGRGNSCGLQAQLHTTATAMCSSGFEKQNFK